MIAPTSMKPSTSPAPDLAERIERESAWVGELDAALHEVIVGQDELLHGLLLALLTNGHVLLEGLPGLAKTLAVSTLAGAVHGTFARIQFTPDLLPSDLVGTEIYNVKEASFQVRRGPVFANFVLADEINRAPAKVQSALLEAMQERQVSIGGQTFPLPKPFLVLATQNPIEHEGTYPLPEAQLDRFLLRISVGYPSRDDELGILQQRRDRRTDEVVLDQVVDAETLMQMQQALEDVYVAGSLGYYIVDVVRATRDSPSVQVGASPRGTLAVMKLARARAVLDGRDFVVPDDVKAVAAPALAHRLSLRPELWVQQVRAEDVVAERLATVPTPPAEER